MRQMLLIFVHLQLLTLKISCIWNIIFPSVPNLPYYSSENEKFIRKGCVLLLRLWAINCDNSVLSAQRHCSRDFLAMERSGWAKEKFGAAEGKLLENYHKSHFFRMNAFLLSWPLDAIQKSAHSYTERYIYAYIDSYMYMCAYICLCMHVNMYVCIYACMYLPVHV